MKQLAVFTTALVLVGAGFAPTWAKGPAVHPAIARTSQTAQPPSVNQVLARSWTGDNAPLRDQLAWNTSPSVREDDDFDAYISERAAISTCQAKRYDASRSNLLDGGTRPLREC